MTNLKICGLRDIETASVAAKSGADYLGFVFVSGVRRQLSIGKARALIQDLKRSHEGPMPNIVGLFADQPMEYVNRAIVECDLDLIQLCGQEPTSYFQLIHAPIIKVIKVLDTIDHDRAIEDCMSKVEQTIHDAHGVILDKHDPGSKGGTGKTFNWQIAAEVATRYDITLAGGLTPENIVQAISVVNPWGVDVSTGVETNGVKDPTKIYEFAGKVKLTPNS